jgi:hypothetical protein
MALFGKSWSDYVRFQKILLVLTVAFGLARLILSMAGVPGSLVTWFSMTGLLPIGAIIYPIRVHMKGFGGFGSVLVLIGIQVLVSQVMTAIGIFAALLTGVDNIFSPAAADANHLWHAIVHLATFPIVSIVLWLPASLILLAARLVLRPR